MLFTFRERTNIAQCILHTLLCCFPRITSQDVRSFIETTKKKKTIYVCVKRWEGSVLALSFETNKNDFISERYCVLYL